MCIYCLGNFIGGEFISPFAGCVRQWLTFMQVLGGRMKKMLAVKYQVDLCVSSTHLFLPFLAHISEIYCVYHLFSLTVLFNLLFSFIFCLFVFKTVCPSWFLCVSVLVLFLLLLQIKMIATKDKRHTTCEIDPRLDRILSRLLFSHNPPAYGH